MRKNLSIINIDETKPLTKEEQLTIFTKLKSLNKESDQYNYYKELLFKKNLRLFSKIKKSYYMFGSIDDIICKCYTGLYKAIDSYEPSKGMPFSSYALKYLKLEVERKMYEEYFDSTKYSKRTFLNLRRYFVISNKFEAKNGYKPLLEDVILEMNLSKRNTDKLVDMINDYNLIFNTISLDKSVGDEDKTLLDYEASTTLDPEESYMATLTLQKRLDKLLTICSKEEVDMVYLLAGHNTFSDIANIYDISEYEVKAVLNNVKDKVKHSGLKLECF